MNFLHKGYPCLRNTADIRVQVNISCWQRGVVERQEASVLARSAASVAISQVIPAVMTFDTDRIYKMIDMLKAGLPGHAPGSLSGVLQSHCGLGLGMLLARLFEEHFTDVGGTKVWVFWYINYKEICFMGDCIRVFHYKRASDNLFL